MRKFASILLLLSLCIGGAASAQSTLPVFCGDLSDADCAILTNSQSAMQSLDSASFDLTVNATVTNVPDMDEPLTFSIVGNGSYTGASSLQSDMLDMMTMQTNPAEIYVKLLENLDFDLTLTLALPPELLRRANDPTMPSNITLQVRLVDGVGYVNLDPLQPIINQPNLTGWAGLDLANLLKTVLEQRPDLFESMTSGMNSMDMTAYMQQFTDPQFLNQFMTITRTDDGSGATATFHMTLDFAALMSSPAMRDMIMQQMEMQGQTLTEAQMEQAMAMSAQMMQGMSISLDQEVGVTDGFIRTIRGTFDFDASSMMSAMRSDSMKKQRGAGEEAAPSIHIEFTLNYRDFNSAPPITAPENLMLFPYQLLLSGLLPTPTPTRVFVPTLVPSPTAIGTAEVTAEPTSEVTEPGGGEPTEESTEPGGGGEVTEEPTQPGGGGEVTEEPTTVPTVTDVPTEEPAAGS